MNAKKCLGLCLFLGQLTDLGPIGNSETVRAFAQFKNSGQTCEQRGSGKRVLVTGFGLFSGIPYNISGVVVSALADVSGTHPRGNRVYQRSVTLNGEAYELCLAILDVRWDLAASIIIELGRRFQPELILMTGRGSRDAILEAGAINRVSHLYGYDSEGMPLLDHAVPLESWVLEEYPVGATLPMSWDNQTLASVIEPMVAETGYRLWAPDEPRRDNAYICNNVSFAVINAANNLETSLAGGKIVFSSGMFERLPRVGFFHFPAVDLDQPSPDAAKIMINDWASVVRALIVAALRARV